MNQDAAEHPAQSTSSQTPSCPALRCTALAAVCAVCQTLANYKQDESSFSLMEGSFSEDKARLAINSCICPQPFSSDQSLQHFLSCFNFWLSYRNHKLQFCPWESPFQTRYVLALPMYLADTMRLKGFPNFSGFQSSNYLQLLQMKDHTKP